MTPELSRPVAVERIGADRPLEITVRATPEECRAVAGRLMIPGVEALACRYELARRGGRIVADAVLDARVIRDCVVSLEPFEATLREAFELHFVPSGQGSEDDDPLAPDEIEYDGPTIDLGETSVEQLALALDPYPRSPEAVLPGFDPQPEAEHPFARLARPRQH